MMHAMFKVNDPKPSLISFAICLATWSKVSHCELLFSDGSILNTDPKRGVHFTSVDERQYDFYNWIALPLPEISKTQEEIIKTSGRQYIEAGCKYDYLGAIFGGLFGCQDGNRWFCSELCAKLLSPFYLEIDPKKWYSPKSLWKLLAASVSKTLQLPNLIYL